MRRCRGVLERLTPREFQVMRLVITGLLNKQVGAQLGMAERTVKTHRGHVMQRVGDHFGSSAYRRGEKS